MTTPNQIKIAELDFDQILQNIIEMMKSDPAFTDYDFSGSGLRLLTRILAYSTFYSAYYLTNAVNESFLDTAQLRSSVAAHARMLGYAIKGTQSARLYANVQIQLSNTAPQQVTLPMNSQFTLAANALYSFWNVQDEILVKNPTTLLYEGFDVQLIEGRPLLFQFTVDTSNPAQQFVIPNANVDYGAITVTVQSQNSNVVEQFIRADNFLTIGPTDKAFFVQESFNGFPELKFGNGVLGAALNNGDAVSVRYYISRGPDANGIRGPFRVAVANVVNFVSGNTVTDANSVGSSGGTIPETLDSVRFLAPLVYQTQNRCVTASDYKALILQNYGQNIGAINVFGGELGNPNDVLLRPSFGHVYIVLKPKIGLFFTEVIKQSIIANIVVPHSVLGIIPEVIDPDYVYIVVSTSVKYDPKATTLTTSQLQQNIANSITTYAEQNIEKFDTSFRFSKFVRVIDDTDDSILSSLTRLDLEKRIYPTLGKPNDYVLRYGSPIRRNGADSVVLESVDHRFNYTDRNGVTKEKCFLTEANGILNIAFRNSLNEIQTFVGNIGSVDVANGVISISNFVPQSIEGGQIDIRIAIIPETNDFVPKLNQLYTVDNDSIHIQLLNDATATLDDQINFFAGGILP